MPRVSGLGHVGLLVEDLDLERDFYVDVLGMKVADELPEQGIVFLSCDPEKEHHELLLCRSNGTPTRPGTLEQVSFRCDDLKTVVDYYRLFQSKQIKIEMTVSHGNAACIYFFDPEGNRCEVYWATGVWTKQPFMQRIDLTAAEVGQLESELTEFARAHAESGYVDPVYVDGEYLDLA